MKKRKVRKIYSTEVNPILIAMESASIIPKNQLEALLVRELSSLDAISKGHGSLQEWNDLVAANNMAEELALMGIGKPEVLPVSLECQKHLIDAAARFERTGKIGLTGLGIQALREMIEYHHLQRSSISRSVYEKALRSLKAKVSSGHVACDVWAFLSELQKKEAA